MLPNDKQITTRIALVDDHELLRISLQNVLETDSNIRVVISAGGTGQLLNKLNSVTEPPDICIMEMGLNEMSIEVALKEIRSQFPNMHILILTRFKNENLLLRLIRLGISGYLDKSCALIELKTAVNSILFSGRYYSRYANKQVFSIALSEDRSYPDFSDGDFTLIMHFLKQETFKAMAVEMRLALPKFNALKTRLYHKFAVNSRTALLREAISLGIILFEEPVKISTELDTKEDILFGL